MSKANFAKEDLSRWKKEINPAPIFSKRIKIRRENQEFLGCCPDVFHKAKLNKSDNNPSLRIWKMDNGCWGFKCFSCGSNGNVFQFVQAVDKIPFAAAVARVLEEAGVEGWQDGTAQEEPTLPAEEPKEYATFTLTQYKPAIEALEHAPEAQAWLRKRGISMETARRFMLGFIQSAEKITSKNAWRDDGWVLFPTLSTGDDILVTSVKYRSVVNKKGKVKGKDNSGILRAPNTSTTLFNARCVTPTEDVWICEGEPDTMVLAQAGLRAVGLPMAEYKVTDDEIELLLSAKRRFLAGDSDKPGAKAMETLLEKMPGETFRVQWPNKRKDANDVFTKDCDNNVEKFKTLLEELKERAIQTEPELVLRTAADIQLRRIKWLWPGKIPFGKLTLFAGNPDNGKSLASTSVAAHVSTGRALPVPPGDEIGYEKTAGDVLMMLGEDDAEDTAAPRLIAAGADMRRIHLSEALRPAQQDSREIRLDKDMAALELELKRNSNIRLLIIDPISNYLGEVNMNTEQEVRGIVVPLKRLAEKYNIAVIMVMHLNKKSELDAINRVGGAMAFTGVSRCSWLFMRDPKEEPVEGEQPATPPEKKPDSFSMRRIKNNLVAASDSGLAYTVETAKVPIPGEPPMIVPFVQWQGIVEGSADDAIGQRRRQSEPGTPRKVGRPNEALQKAINWLSGYMQDGAAHSVKIVRADARLAENIAFDTLGKAYIAIGGVKAFKSGNGWFWRVDPMNATAEALQSADDEIESEIDFEDSSR